MFLRSVLHTEGTNWPGSPQTHHILLALQRQWPLPHTFSGRSFQLTRDHYLTVSQWPTPHLLTLFGFSLPLEPSADGADQSLITISLKICGLQPLLVILSISVRVLSFQKKKIEMHSKYFMLTMNLLMDMNSSETPGVHVNRIRAQNETSDIM